MHPSFFKHHLIKHNYIFGKEDLSDSNVLLQLSFLTYPLDVSLAAF